VAWASKKVSGEALDQRLQRNEAALLLRKKKEAEKREIAIRSAERYRNEEADQS